MTAFYATQNDNKTVLSLILRNGPHTSSGPVDLTAASAVVMHAKPAGGGSVLTKTCSFTASSAGSVSVELAAADLATADVYHVEWQITFAGGTVDTLPKPGYDTLTIQPELA